MKGVLQLHSISLKTTRVPLGFFFNSDDFCLKVPACMGITECVRVCGQCLQCTVLPRTMDLWKVMHMLLVASCCSYLSGLVLWRALSITKKMWEDAVVIWYYSVSFLPVQKHPFIGSYRLKSLANWSLFLANNKRVFSFFKTSYFH